MNTARHTMSESASKVNGVAKEVQMRGLARRTASLLFLAGVVVASTVTADRDVVVAQQRKPVRVTRLFTGADGQTHAENIDVQLAQPEVTSRGRSTASELSAPIKVSGLQFRRTSPAYSLDFHTAPARQYVVTLSGRGEIELADGTKIPLTPGHILLAEDVTGKGHISRGVGSEDRLSLFIQLADK